MTRTVVTRTIKAPAAEVFDIVAHIDAFSQVQSQIVRVEFLSEQHRGVGTRFKETRSMNGREASTELEVTEYVAGERVRMVADAGGTIWDTTFLVRTVGEQTELQMVLEARAHKLLPKLVNPLIRGFVQKAIERDLDAVKDHCERSAAAG